MKSTYKLLGVAWDHASLPDTCPEFVEEKRVENWEIERNLFDLQIYEFLRRQLPTDTDLVIIGSKRIEMACKKLLLKKQVCI